MKDKYSLFCFMCVIHLCKNITLRIKCKVNYFIEYFFYVSKKLFVFLYGFPINYLTLVIKLFKNAYSYFVYVLQENCFY